MKAEQVCRHDATATSSYGIGPAVRLSIRRAAPQSQHLQPFSLDACHSSLSAVVCLLECPQTFSVLPAICQRMYSPQRPSLPRASCAQASRNRKPGCVSFARTTTRGLARRHVEWDRLAEELEPHEQKAWANPPSVTSENGRGTGVQPPSAIGFLVSSCGSDAADSCSHDVCYQGEHIRSAAHSQTWHRCNCGCTNCGVGHRRLPKCASSICYSCRARAETHLNILSGHPRAILQAIGPLRD